MQELTKICSACSAENHLGAKFCRSCSAPFVTPPPEMQPVYNWKFQGRQEVIVTDFNMSFGSMIIFMVKWAFAAIPAMIILFIIGMVMFMILAGMGGALR